ncbi:MAG: MFS transporter [Burkholderiaceae bacterium]
MTQDALATRAGLWSLASAYFMLATGSLAVIGLVQPMAESWRVTPADVASLVTVFALTLAVSAPLVQILLGHLARRTLIIGGLTLMASGLAITAAAPDFTWGIVGRVLAGAGAASVGPIASALGADLVSPQRQPQALATVFFGMTFATVAGVPLTTWLGFLFGWRAVFVLLAIAAMACAGAVALLVSNRASGGRIRLRALFGTVSRASVAWAVLTGLLQMAASFASYALVALYLAER